MARARVRQEMTGEILSVARDHLARYWGRRTLPAFHRP